MQIVIPTHKRPHRQITLNTLPAALRPDVLLVVSTQEDFDIFKNHYKHKNVKIAPVKTIADKRQWIMENVKAKKILMLDDDMDIQARCPLKERKYVEGRWKAVPPHQVSANRYATEKYVTQMLAVLDSELDSYAHVGISSRMGNDVVEESWKPNARMMHAIAYDRTVFNKEKIRFNEVQCREDFNVTLHLLRRGYANVVLHDLMVNPRSYGAAGGCSDERTVERSNAEALKLAALHPGFVKVVDKEYKNTPRKEVIIAWRKALNAEGAE